MDLRYTFSNRHPLVYLVLKGRLELAELIAFFEHVLTHRSFSPGTAVLLDARNCSTSDLKHGQLLRLGEASSALARTNGMRRCAWVSRRDVDFGVARMFECLTEKHRSYTFRAFRGMAAACRWLQRPTDRQASSASEENGFFEPGNVRLCCRFGAPRLDASSRRCE